MTPDPSVIDLDLVDHDIGDDVVDSPPPPAEPAEAAPPSDGGSALGLLAFLGAVIAIGFLRSWWIPAILAGLLFMLFMHELGHYITARISGMKVTEFFLGFGPRIWSFRRGETEYGIKAIPAGAYVRIIGMTNLDDIDPAEEHRTYRAQPYWQRMMTICAGSAMHFLMAGVAIFVLFTSYSYQGFNGPPWVIGGVQEGSTAIALGIQPGDSIESVNGESFANWDEFGVIINDLDPGPVVIQLKRDGEPMELQGELGLRPQDVVEWGFGMRVSLEEPTAGHEVFFLWPSDQAAQFGFERGDVIARAGDIAMPSEIALAAFLLDNDGGQVTFEVDREIVRNGERVTERVSLDGQVDLDRSVPLGGFFGVWPEFIPEGQPSSVAAAGDAVGDFVDISQANIASLVDLVNPARWFGSGENNGAGRRTIGPSVQQETAPTGSIDVGCAAPDSDTNRPLSVIGIGRLISCSESADQVIFLFAVVNIFIGIFNLVPMLPLDGGHAAIATYERIRGLLTGKTHRVDAAKLIPITWLVIFALVGVGVWTTTLDLFSWPG